MVTSQTFNNNGRRPPNLCDGSFGMRDAESLVSRPERFARAAVIAASNVSGVKMFVSSKEDG